MRLFVLTCSLLLAATGQQEDDDWIDPFDMLNYDASTKTMRKPAEPGNYPNVPTKRREYTQDSSPQMHCDGKVRDLQKEIEEQKKRIVFMSQQPTCAPVFKRFLSRLLKEINRVGVPGDSDVLYDAKIKLSKQALAEIQTLLEGEDSWRTGALDNALSQILVDLRPHDYEAWKWHFEDTFGVELDTLLKMGLFVLVVVAIICTQLWSAVSWFIQFKRLFAACFFISIIWNWLYLYKISFAEHQSNMAKMDGFNEKCSGMKKIDWSDSLKEWFRTTWTLQDDPCKKYYEILTVNPLLLVPPTKAISVTITTFITEPLKHFGQGISEFLRALLKDLPVTLQIPVLLTIVLSIVVCMYGGVHAAFQHGITAPFRRPRRDPPPPELPQPQPRHLQIEDHLAEGDAPQHAPRRRDNEGRLQRNQVHQRRQRPREEPVAKVVVETLRTAESPFSEDEMDNQQRETEQNLSAESDTENQQQTQEEPAGESASRAAANTTKPKPAGSDSSESMPKSLEVKENFSKDGLSRDGAESKPQPAERRPPQTDTNAKDPAASAEDGTTVETLGVPVQESSPVTGE